LYKSKIPYEIKLQVIEDYLAGKITPIQIKNKIGVNKATIFKWVAKYKALGLEGLMDTSKNTSYPTELKLHAVLDYLDGKGSMIEIIKKYKIRNVSQLESWIKKYNNHDDFKSSHSGGSYHMINGKKTTQDERVEIVSYCIENGKDYVKAIEKYGVSYQQIYTWVKKYEEKGVGGLTDKRGRKKPDNEMSEVEKLKAENKLLQAKLRRSQMEIDVLKKLEEVERR
jgi:transposase-like protein